MYKLLVQSVALLFVFSGFSQNRAPSLWFNYKDYANGDIIMTDVRVPQNENPETTYYSTLNFNSGAEMGGYAGIQNHDGEGHIIIFSIWDPLASNEAIKADYAAPGMEIANFGGEGTGLRSKNLTYQWNEDVWYTQVLRTWQYNGHTFVGYFLYDEDLNKWSHFVTMDFPVANIPFNSGGTGSFLENWYPKTGHDGNYSRTMHLRNGYKRATDGSWLALNNPRFARVSPDAGASNFIEKYDSGSENGYLYMQSGGATSPTITSGSNVSISMASEPNVSTGSISNITTSLDVINNELTVDWSIDETKSPQLSYTVEIFDNASYAGSPLTTITDIKPHLRNLTADLSAFADGKYFARMSIDDIFDQTSAYQYFQFVIGNQNIDNDIQLSSLVISNKTCDGDVAFDISVLNNGKNVILDFTIQSFLNGVLVDESIQSLTIASGEVKIIDVSLSGLSLTGNDDIEVNLVLANDEISSNNSQSTPILTGTIPQTDVSIVSFSTQEDTGEGVGNGQAIHVLDGDASTFWHAQWTGGGSTMPHEIVFDLGANYELDKILWLNRQNNTNGFVKTVEFSFSSDNINWGTTETKTLQAIDTEQELMFSGKMGRYVKVNMTENFGGTTVASLAEVNFFGCENNDTQTPVVDFTIDASTATNCETVTFTSSTTPVGTVYSWDFGSGATPATATGVGPHDVVYSTTGSKTIALTVDGQTETKVNAITITDGQITPTIAIQASQTTICGNEQVDFTIASQSNEGTSPSYEWFVGSTSAGTGTTYSSISLTDGDKVKVVLTSDASCVSTTTATSNEVTMNVSNSVTPTIVIQASQTTICGNGQVDFTIATQSNEGTNPSYEWFVGSTSVGIGTTYSSTTLADGDKVKVVLTSDANCVSTTTATSNEVTMNVSNSVTPTIAIQASQTTICGNGQVDFTIASQSNEGTSPSYEWFVGSTSVGTGTTYSSTTLADGDKIKVVLTSNANCVSTTTVTSNEVTMNVSNSVTPTIAIQASQTTICGNGQVDFTITSQSNEGTSPSYEWFVGSTSVGTGTTYSSTSLTDGDKIKVTLTSDANCVSTTTVTSNEEVITITTGTSASISIALKDATFPVCSKETTVYQATTVGSGTAPIEWYIDGIKILENPTLSVDNTTDGTVIQAKVTSDLTCASTGEVESNTITTEVIDCITGLKYLDEANYSVYPNPAHDKIYIAGSNIDDVDVINAVGEIILTQQVNGNEYILNTSYLETGIYFIRIHSKGGQVIKQIYKN